MKKAFTMIELIFVIVILGILASIAVPKLGNVKQKAEVVKGATALSVVITDLVTNFNVNNNYLADDKGAIVTNKDGKALDADVTAADLDEGKLKVAGENCGTFKYVCDTTGSLRCSGATFTVHLDSTNDRNCKAFYEDKSVLAFFKDKDGAAAATPTDGEVYKVNLNTGKLEFKQ